MAAFPRAPPALRPPLLPPGPGPESVPESSAPVPPPAPWARWGPPRLCRRGCAAPQTRGSQAPPAAGAAAAGPAAAGQSNRKAQSPNKVKVRTGGPGTSSQELPAMDWAATAAWERHAVGPNAQATRHIQGLPSLSWNFHTHQGSRGHSTLDLVQQSHGSPVCPGSWVLERRGEGQGRACLMTRKHRSLSPAKWLRQSRAVKTILLGWPWRPAVEPAASPRPSTAPTRSPCASARRPRAAAALRRARGLFQDTQGAHHCGLQGRPCAGLWEARLRFGPRGTGQDAEGEVDGGGRHLRGTAQGTAQRAEHREPRVGKIA